MSSDETAQLVPPIAWGGAAEEGASRCPDCHRVYHWRRDYEDRGLYPETWYQLTRLTPTQAAERGLQPVPDWLEGYRQCLAHPEAWVREEARKVLGKTAE